MSGTWIPAGGPTSGNDRFTAAASGSAASGLGGNDTLVGANGSDTLSGDDGNDSISGGNGNDLLFGGAGVDQISGGSGNDTIEGGAGADELFGGAGSDIVSYASDTAGVTVDLDGNGNYTVSGGDAQGDTLNSFEHAIGGSGTDSLIGTTGANTLDGGDGADTLRGDDGADTLLGGAGGDWMFGDAAADLLRGGGEGDTLIGGLGGDVLEGEAGDDSLLGEVGSDTLRGGDGNDTLNGGSNADMLEGGDGSDVLDGGGPEADFLDFGAGNDSFTYVDGMGSDTLDGGAGVDRLFLPDLSSWTIGSAPGGYTTYTRAGVTLQVRDWEQVVCFAQGTRIMTDRGEVPVEALRAGDMVLTLAGTARLVPVAWVGHRYVELLRHRMPAQVAPVVVRQGALGRGVPVRDLRLSPDHALYIDGRLVPVRLLVDGDAIRQEAAARDVTYWHVELEGHGVLIADGAPAESYREDGNRHLFDAPDIAVPYLAFGAQHPGSGCAPQLDAGPELDRLRARLAAYSRTAPSAIASVG